MKNPNYILGGSQLCLFKHAMYIAGILTLPGVLLPADRFLGNFGRSIITYQLTSFVNVASLLALALFPSN